MKKSESIREIAVALSKFQGEVLNPKNTSINPNFNSKYAPLCEVINATKEILAKYGLSIIQTPYTEGDSVVVETILLHNSGEWIKSPPLKLKMDNITAQGAGSAITYARRYALSAILNISSEEDNDGNEIDGASVPVKATSINPTSPNDVAITDKQIKFIHVLAREKGIDKVSLQNYSISMFGKDSSKDLTKNEASQLIEAMQSVKPNVETV